MTDAEAEALPGADPANAAHPSWAAMTLATILREQDGFDRIAIASAFVAAAQQLAREEGVALAFAITMEEAAISMAREVALASIPTENLMRN